MGNRLIDRKAVLEEILSIEDQIRTERTNPTYLNVKRNLSRLEDRVFGSTTVSVQSLDDPSKMVNIKYNSSKMKETVTLYRERRTEFDAKINKLQVRIASLRGELFK
jgi:hypothetical protein